MEESKTKVIIDVQTGQVKFGAEGSILRTSAMGSCVVVTAYDSKRKVGSSAHIMLPGRSSRETDNSRYKYAEDAIDQLLSLVYHEELSFDDLEVCILGGANVLKRSEDTIGKNNIDSVIEYLRKKGLRIKAQAVGGTTRRSSTFHLESGSVFYTEGDEQEQLLWASFS